MGAWIEGVAHNGEQFTGGPLAWLSPFSLYCAVSLLGACWLAWRYSGPLALIALLAVFPFILPSGMRIAPDAAPAVLSTGQLVGDRR